jgi:hypothetical protein
MVAFTGSLRHLLHPHDNPITVATIVSNYILLSVDRRLIRERSKVLRNARLRFHGLPRAIEGLRPRQSQRR